MAPLTEEEAQRSGFDLVTRETFSHDESFSPDDLVRFLVTQSNVIAAVEQGDEPIEGVAAWLRSEVDPHSPCDAPRAAVP